MMNDRDTVLAAELDDLLARWHVWQQGEQLGRGHAREALVCGQYRTSRQYDDVSGKLDDDLDAFRCRQVNHEVRQMEDPHRTAIYVIARNLSTGREVWQSPRLPAIRADREVVLKFARLQLTKRLVSAGVM